MNEQLLQTPLHAWHLEQSARMVDFAGWSMPVQYTSIVEEHRATRQRCGLFDVSHMARLRFEGPSAAEFLDYLLTRRVADLPLGKARYSLMLNEQGGILDDVLVTHLETPAGQRYYLLVVNAGNRSKIKAWIEQHREPRWQVTVHDRTEETAMLAVQGPRAVEVVNPLLDVDLAALPYYSAAVTRSRGRVCIVSRTGYTGEDGCELIVRAEEAVDVCRNVMRAGRDAGIQPAGLGCRDTLRLEAGMPLYGHELNEQIEPYQAGLGFAVNLKDRDFLGKQAVERRKDDPNARRRVGLELSGRRPAREHYPVLAEGREVGEVTSGTFSPTLERPLAMAYVDPPQAAPDTDLEVDVRGQRAAARVVKLPFYARPR